MFQIIKSNDKATGTNGDCIIHLNQRIGGQYGLYSFIFTNTLYNVNSTNNRFVITDTSDTIISNVLLDEGFYTGSELADKITSAITDLTATFDDNTNKFTFTYTSNFKLAFSTTYNNTCWELLGFAQSNYTSSSLLLSSVMCADFNPHKTLFITIKKASKPIENNSQSNHHEYTFMISDSTSTFGSLFRYIQDDPLRQQYTNINTTRTLSIEIRDDDNNVIDPTNWIMILQRK